MLFLASTSLIVFGIIILIAWIVGNYHSLRNRKLLREPTEETGIDRKYTIHADPPYGLPNPHDFTSWPIVDPQDQIFGEPLPVTHKSEEPVVDVVKKSSPKPKKKTATKKKTKKKTKK